MSVRTIKMPDIGEGIAEVELVAWHVKVGDVVAEDQILADVMTDKATVEIPSHVAGTVLSLGCAVGQVVAVGAEIIRIEASDGQAANPASAASTAQPVAAIALESSAPQTRQEAAQLQLSPNGQELPSRPNGPDKAETGNAAPRADNYPLAAPAVRHRAQALGLDLSQINGTGAQGHITHTDLEAFAARTASHGSSTRAPVDGNDVQTTIPIIGLRRKIAQKMQDAKRRIPHFTYVEEVDVTELETLRAKLNSQYGKTRGRLTLLPFLVRAMVLAAHDHPEVNARYDDDADLLTRHSAVHLGIATQTNGGLMVPVIRHAQTLDLWACAAEIARLAQAARSGKVTREELTGSTLTLTSLGALGGIVSTPVINHPEVAIVGTNRIVERPMIVGGAVVARKMMNLSSSFDHRVVDGMHAAEFIQQVRGLLECPATLFIA